MYFYFQESILGPVYCLEEFTQTILKDHNRIAASRDSNPLPFASQVDLVLTRQYYTIHDDHSVWLDNKD